jgi:hypothetical protein
MTLEFIGVGQVLFDAKPSIWVLGRTCPVLETTQCQSYIVKAFDDLMQANNLQHFT